MSELSEILRKEYKKKEEKKPVDFSMLMEMVEQLHDAIEPEVMGPQKPKQNTLFEKEMKQAVNVIEQNMKNILDFLPKIEISEAWGQKDSDEASARQQFEMYMNKIRGNTVKGKLLYINGFIQESIGDKSFKTEEILANLMFLDLLSTVVNNFSPSGAGFLFEAFMAGLLRGTQSVEKAGGELQIDDLIDAEGKPISLKLLVPTTPIKGSIKNLIGFLANNPGGINYLCVYKYGKGETSALGFYEFQITPRNIYFWLAKDFGKSVSLKEGLTKNEKIQRQTQDMVNKSFAKTKTQIPRLSWVERDKDAIISMMVSSDAQKAFDLATQASEEFRIPLTNFIDRARIDATAEELAQLEAEEIHSIIKARRDLFKYLQVNLPSDHPLGFFRGTKKFASDPMSMIDFRADQRTVRGKGREQWSIEDLDNLYREDPRAWANVLLDAAGLYHRLEEGVLSESKESQFEISSDLVTKTRLPELYQHDYLGNIKIDRKVVEKTGQEYTKKLTGGVVAIFEQLNLVTSGITGYFLSSKQKDRFSKGQQAEGASLKLVSIIQDPEIGIKK